MKNEEIHRQVRFINDLQKVIVWNEHLIRKLEMGQRKRLKKVQVWVNNQKLILNQKFHQILENQAVNEENQPNLSLVS